MNAPDNLAKLLVVVWATGSFMLFLLNGTRAALIDMRYRSMRAPIDEERKRWNTLIQWVRSSHPHHRLFRLLHPVFALVNSAAFGWIVAFLFVRWGFNNSITWFSGLLTFILAMAGLALHLWMLELLPRTLAVRFPAPFLFLSQALMPMAAWLVHPALKLADSMDGLMRKALIRSQHPLVEPLDHELQISALDIDDPDMTPVTEKIVAHALGLNDLTVYDVLLPRNQVQYFDINDSLKDNLELSRTTGHTRFPLCEGDLDACIGIVHIKDIYRFRGAPEKLDLRKIRRDIIRFDLDMPLDTALQTLLSKRIHMALAQDEFGGVAGIITLERILEELVGDIHDEFDRGEERMIIRIKKDFFRVSGIAPIHELEEVLGIDIDNDDVSTLGGLVVAELGRIPEPGETLGMGRMVITVQEADEKRVLSCTLKLLPPLSEEPID